MNPTEQVKQREFLRDFTKYKDKTVEVIGRHDELIGSWICAVDLGEDVRQTTNLSDKGGVQKMHNGLEEPKEMSDNRKEIADEIVNKVMSKDSTENTEPTIGDTEVSAINGGNPEIVGTCDICHNPSKELWEHEEEGISMDVCKDCFRGKFQGDDTAFEKFLRRKHKIVSYTDNGFKEIKTSTGVWMSPNWKKPAKFTDFNPIPKPVKKEKKK